MDSMDFFLNLSFEGKKSGESVRSTTDNLSNKISHAPDLSEVK